MISLTNFYYESFTRKLYNKALIFVIHADTEYVYVVWTWVISHLILDDIYFWLFDAISDNIIAASWHEILIIMQYQEIKW